MGSPPQVRGKLILSNKSINQSGITPAGAGKTFQVLEPQFDNQDHPRRCGENSIFFKSWFVNSGSPPQVRGKRRHSRRFAVMTRITPAGAGKTDSESKAPFGNKDHPRRCGENIIRLIRSVANAGSPPQVRGKQQRQAGAGLRQRITPAGAGKTSYPSISRG